MAHPLDAGNGFEGGDKIGAVRNDGVGILLKTADLFGFEGSCCVASEVAWFFCKGHGYCLILTCCC